MAQLLIDTNELEKCLVFTNTEASLIKWMDAHFFGSWRYFVEIRDISKTHKDTLVSFLSSIQIPRTTQVIFCLDDLYKWQYENLQSFFKENSCNSLGTKNQLEKLFTATYSALFFQRIDERLRFINRTVMKVREWLNQWEKLDLLWLGEDVAKAIRIADKKDILSRLIRSDSGGFFCYLILLEDTHDSSTALLDYLIAHYGDQLGQDFCIAAVRNSADVGDSRNKFYSAPNSQGSCKINWNNIAQIIMVDEVNWTGYKAYSNQFPKLYAFSQNERKKIPAQMRFAYATELATNYSTSNHWSHQFVPQNFTVTSASSSLEDWIWKISSTSPMALALVPEERMSEAMRASTEIGKQLRNSSDAMGKSGLATCLLFENVASGNTYPPLLKESDGPIKYGKKSIEIWRPLVRDRKRSQPKKKASS
jgi:hypothetical protein